MAGAELVVLAGPPLACADLLRRLGSDLRASLEPGATVTDVASTKGVLVAIARAAGIPYVGGHPMAGRETSGFAAADAGLFRGRPWVICEPVAGGDPARVRALALACGARPVELDAETHDRLVAAISHLPLITSVALVEAVAGTSRGRGSRTGPRRRRSRPPGWRDTTRLARGDVTMGAEIAVTNAAALAVRLRAYRDRIDEWIAAARGPRRTRRGGGPEPPRRGARATGGLTWATPASRSSSCPARRSFPAMAGSACGATASRRPSRPWRARGGSSCARRRRRTRA